MVARDVPARVELQPVADLVEVALRETDRVRSVIHRDLGMSEVEVVPFGATSYPDGVTKGDIDVLLRVPPASFDWVVERLSEMMAVAQPENWEATFASFTDTSSSMPIGVQVTAMGCSHDREIDHQRRLLRDPHFRAAYDHVKQQSAHLGPDGYWQAKDDFWQRHALDPDDGDDATTSV